MNWERANDGYKLAYLGMSLDVRKPRADMPFARWAGLIDGVRICSAPTASGCRILLIDIADERKSEQYA